MFVNDVPISFPSTTQKSVTEPEIAAGVMVAQDMLYIYRLLESLELEVELPMILEMDNSGAVDIANSWSVGGRTRHVDERTTSCANSRTKDYWSYVISQESRMMLTYSPRT